MEVFKHRPLAAICWVFIAGAVFGALLGALFRTVGALVSFILSAVLLTLYIFPLKKGRKKAAVGFAAVLCVFLCLSLVLSAVFFDVRVGGKSEYFGDERQIVLNVDERLNSGNQMTVFSVRVSQIDGCDTDVKCILSCGYVSNLQPGYVCRLTAGISDFSDGGLFDRRNMLSDGFFMLVTSDSEDSVEILSIDSKPSLGRRLEIIRNSVSERLSMLVGGDEGALASALVLGDREGLDGKTEIDFRRAGGSHLLALSGMHVSVIFGFFELAMIGLGIRKKFRGIVLFTFGIAYLILTGFSPSATRAVLMASAAYCAWFFFASADAFTSVSAAAALMLACSPSTVLSYGFWLSVSATVGIVVFSRTYSRIVQFISQRITKSELINRFVIYLLSSLSVSLIALASVIVLSAVWFGSISYMTPVTTVLLSIPTAGMLVVGSVTLIFAKVPLISSVLAGICRIIGRFMLTVTSKISDIDGILLPLSYPAVRVVCGISAAVLVFVLLFGFRKKLIAAAVLPIAVAAIFITANICVFSDGGVAADCISTSSKGVQIAFSRRESAVICDMSQGSSVQTYETLERLENVTELDALILTDFKSQHPIMVSEFAERIKVRRLFVPEPNSYEEYYLLKSLSKKADKYGIQVLIYSDGERISADYGGYITVSRSTVYYSSVQTVFAEFGYGDDSLIYVTPAYLYANEVDASYADAVIFGSTGPICKSVYGIEVDSDADLVFGSQNVAAFADSGITDGHTGGMYLAPEVYSRYFDGK